MEFLAPYFTVRRLKPAQWLRSFRTCCNKGIANCSHHPLVGMLDGGVVLRIVQRAPARAGGRLWAGLAIFIALAERGQGVVFRAIARHQAAF